jgi:predicted DNA-binding WGR domain protein
MCWSGETGRIWAADYLIIIAPSVDFRGKIDNLPNGRRTCTASTYQIRVTLFGEVVLIKEWGRISFSGRMKEEFFNSTDLALSALKKHQAAKMRRGYSITRA